MRKAIITLLAMASAMTGYAQYRDVKLPEKPAEREYRDYSSHDKGFWCAVEAEGGSSIMSDLPNMQHVTLTFTGGYRISEYLRLGVGAGGRVYVNNADVRNTDNRFGVPVFANARGNFISAYDRDGVPFWSFNIGGVTNDGFFASPAIGYSFGGLRDNFQIGLTYTIAAFKDCTQTSRAYSYFGLKLGYEF